MEPEILIFGCCISLEVRDTNISSVEFLQGERRFQICNISRLSHGCGAGICLIVISVALRIELA